MQGLSTRLVFNQSTLPDQDNHKLTELLTARESWRKSSIEERFFVIIAKWQISQFSVFNWEGWSPNVFKILTKMAFYRFY